MYMRCGNFLDKGQQKSDESLSINVSVKELDFTNGSSNVSKPDKCQYCAGGLHKRIKGLKREGYCFDLSSSF